MRHDLHEPTINALVGAFLRAVKAGEAEFTIPMTHLDDWDVQCKHASDLGKCQRSLSHRVHGDDKSEKTMTQLDNEARQFYVANTIHHMLYNALQWDDRLFSFEIDVSAYMENGFTGEADAIWWNFDEELEVIDAKSLHPNWRTYIKQYPKYHNACQIMSYFAAIKKRNSATDKLVKRGRIWYTGRGDKTTSLECPLEWADWGQVVQEEYAEKLAATLVPANTLPVIPKVLKRTGGENRLSKIELAPSWLCEWCDYQGVSCIPHDMVTNSLLYKKDKVWHVSKKGKELAGRILAETGINIDNLNALDDAWGGEAEQGGWTEGS